MAKNIGDFTTITLRKVVLNRGGKEEEHFALEDNYGYLYTKDEFNELVNKVKSFYELDGMDELLQKDNKYIDLLNSGISINQQNEEGLYELPKIEYTYKAFDPEKKHWSCKCGWCGVKVSSKTDAGYYTMTNQTFDIVWERACSEECAELIWKEKVKEWIYEKGYQDFFAL